jgi:hypothetical protein
MRVKTGRVSLMFRSCSRLIALPAVFAGLTIAQAADTILTLACQGTVADATQADAKREPVSMGIIVNFAARTVTGFTYPGGGPVTITTFDDVHVLFSSSSKDLGWTFDGSINLVHGDTEAALTWSDAKTGNIVSSSIYALKCGPAR